MSDILEGPACGAMKPSGPEGWMCGLTRGHYGPHSVGPWPDGPEYTEWANDTPTGTTQMSDRTRQLATSILYQGITSAVSITVRLVLNPAEWSQIRTHPEFPVNPDTGWLSYDNNGRRPLLSVEQADWVPPGLMAVEDHQHNVRLVRLHNYG